MGWHIHSAERKQPSTKNPISDKIIFQNEGKINTFPYNKTWENSLLAYLPSKK